MVLCQKLFGGDTTWKQTYNAGLGTGFRGNYAGIGATYMTNVATLGVASTDIFIQPQRIHHGQLELHNGMHYWWRNGVRAE